MSPPADILGTSTVREAVSLHPEALVTLTSTTVSVVIPVVVSTFAATCAGFAGTPLRVNA